MRLDDVAGNGPGRCCSPHQKMPLSSRNEGSKRVPMTWRATSSAWSVRLLWVVSCTVHSIWHLLELTYSQTRH